MRQTDPAPAGGLAGTRQPPPPRLRPSEQAVLVHLVQGRTNREIAGALGLAPGTVKDYVSQIYLKLGVSCRAQAVATALRRWPELVPRARPATPPGGDDDVPGETGAPQQASIRAVPIGHARAGRRR